jgi:hypothetical protein
MRWLFPLGGAALVVSALLAPELSPASADEPDAQAPANSPAPAAAEALDRAALEEDFARRMTGATLAGSYTELHAPAPQPAASDQERVDEPPPLKQDKYTLGTVKKLKDDLWLFEVRIQYGENDIKLPVPLEVKWAGDTPVITLTDMEIPGLGKFTARVLVYGDQYAGTWSGGDHGGQLFGRVVPASEDAAGEDVADDPAPPKDE